MTAVELKLALVFALFFLAFGLRWILGGRPQRFRRHRFWPPEARGGELIQLPPRPSDKPKLKP